MENNESKSFTDQESEDVAFAQMLFTNSFVACCYPDEVPRTLSLTFEKKFCRTWGGDFYRLRIEAKGKNIKNISPDAEPDLSVRVLVGLMHFLNRCELTLNEPMTLNHDFQGDLVSKAIQISQTIGLMAPQILKSRPGVAGPKNPGPAPGL